MLGVPGFGCVTLLGEDLNRTTNQSTSAVTFENRHVVEVQHDVKFHVESTNYAFHVCFLSRGTTKGACVVCRKAANSWVPCENERRRPWAQVLHWCTWQPDREHCKRDTNMNSGRHGQEGATETVALEAGRVHQLPTCGGLWCRLVTAFLTLKQKKFLSVAWAAPDRLGLNWNHAPDPVCHSENLLWVSFM